MDVWKDVGLRSDVDCREPAEQWTGILGADALTESSVYGSWEREYGAKVMCDSGCTLSSNSRSIDRRFDTRKRDWGPDTHRISAHFSRSWAASCDTDSYLDF